MSHYGSVLCVSTRGLHVVLRYYCEDTTLRAASSAPAAIELFEHALGDVARPLAPCWGCWSVRAGTATDFRSQ